MKIMTQKRHNQKEKNKFREEQKFEKKRKKIKIQNRTTRERKKNWLYTDRHFKNKSHLHSTP